VGRCEQHDEPLGAGELTQHRHQQPQLADAGFPRDEFGEHGGRPATARQLGIEPREAARTGLARGVAELVGTPHGGRPVGS